ncbi:MAG: ubiquitin-like small modifier protein 1 [Halanaeroarchaeum sp.]
MEWKLFADLAEVTGSKRVEVQVAADEPTVEDALQALLDAYPSLRERVLNDEGTLLDHINVLKNGRNVFASDDGLATPIGDDDELAMFPPVSGGSGLGTVR